MGEYPHTVSIGTDVRAEQAELKLARTGHE